VQWLDGEQVEDNEDGEEEDEDEDEEEEDEDEEELLRVPVMMRV
jgi:hypothetical protein